MLNLELWHIWVIVGLTLWIIEMFTPGFVAGVFGMACLIVAPFAGANLTFKAQLLVFAVTTAALALGIRPLILKLFLVPTTKSRTNVDALVGQTGFVTEAIDQYSAGQVKIGGESWRATTPDESRLDVGTKIQVREVDGCKLVVHSASFAERKAS